MNIDNMQFGCVTTDAIFLKRLMVTVTLGE